jgi:hypothetical protein
MNGGPEVWLVGAIVRLKKRGGTYRVAAWDATIQRYILHFVLPVVQRGIRPVYAREDDLIVIEAAQGVASAETEP